MAVLGRNIARRPAVLHTRLISTARDHRARPAAADYSATRGTERTAVPQRENRRAENEQNVEIDEQMNEPNPISECSSGGIRSRRTCSGKQWRSVAFAVAAVVETQRS